MVRPRPIRCEILLVAVLLLAMGCGGDDAAAPAPVTSAPSAPPPTTTPINIKPRSTPEASSPAPGASQKNTTKTEAPKGPDAPPEQIFEVGTDIPNFELLPPEHVAGGNVFALVSPGTGRDSTHVTLIAPDDGEGGPSQPRGAAAIKLPQGFSSVAAAGASEEGLPHRIRCAKDGSEMVLVPGGLYLRGTEDASTDASPVHPVQLSPFYIDEYEVTLEKYRRFQMEQKPPPGKPSNADSPDTHPVLGVSWRDAMVYCEWAGKQLPTEAEWEAAARGAESFTYPWGDGRVVWQRSRTPEQIDPVGSFRADKSVFGVFDMAGNAREWCADFYSDTAYRDAAPRDGTAADNPAGPRRGSIAGHRVVRGNAPGWELWRRGHQHMTEPAGDIGFRGVLRIAAPSASARTDSSNPPPTVAPNSPPRERSAFD